MIASLEVGDENHVPVVSAEGRTVPWRSTERSDRLTSAEVFRPDGTVIGRTPRGAATIDVLALNRSSLVAARKVVAARVVAGKRSPATDTGEFQAVRRQLRKLPKASKGSAKRTVPKASSPPPSDDYDLESAAPMAVEEIQSYFSTVRWIERVRIRNFKPIRDLELDFSGSASENGPWRVLLGENGSGKSSVLQAIALALIGGAYRRELEIPPGRFLRYGARDGSVEVHLTGSPDPLRVTNSCYVSCY